MFLPRPSNAVRLVLAASQRSSLFAPRYRQQLHAGVAERAGLASLTNHGTTTAYEAEKDFWSLKTTIDDIRAKYGLDGGVRIKDANLDQQSDLELEVDLNVADTQRLQNIQSLLAKAAADLAFHLERSATTAGDERHSGKVMWLDEDDDVSGNIQETLKNYRENRVAASGVSLHTYDLEEAVNQKPVGFQNVYGHQQ